ncbi:Protein of unknown function, partial [Gryllus bimaculatus]
MHNASYPYGHARIIIIIIIIIYS